MKKKSKVSLVRFIDLPMNIINEWRRVKNDRFRGKNLHRLVIRLFRCAIVFVDLSWLQACRNTFRVQKQSNAGWNEREKERERNIHAYLPLLEI